MIHHDTNGNPPRGLPGVILKQKECYRLWRFVLRNFPKVERLGVGTKIEQSFLIVLELTFTSAYLPPDQKIILLGKTISKLDVLKFFTQLAWEEKLIPTEKYAELSQQLEHVEKPCTTIKMNGLVALPYGYTSV